MLVSVALVLLIMALFAQAFGIAAGSIKKQRGLAENDQRARSMVTILLGDLQKRTYRQRQDAITQPVNLPVDVDETNTTNNPQDARAVAIKRLEDRANRLSLGLVPLHPDYFIGGWDNAIVGGTPSTAAAPGAAPRNVDSVRERGYFHISEGDPSHDADDRLQFTINMANTELGNLNTSRLTGRAVVLPDLPGQPGLPTWATNDPTLSFDDVELNLDQPIWDDGIGWVENPLTGVRRSYTPDEPGTTASRYAEVSLFIRNGNLYRRVNLIREPLETVPGSDVGEGQPGDGTADFFGPGIDYTSDSFWNDFDHAATRFDIPALSQIHFADIASLDNTIAGETDSTSGPPIVHPNRFWSLGDPRNRFGFDNTAWELGGLQGRPKTYLDRNVKTSYIGGYTHRETSHPTFGYPGVPGHSGGMVSPMRWDQVIPNTAFDDGPREGEDLLLANCHAFDIKVWDDVLGAFVDLGHGSSNSSGVPGDMHLQAVNPGSGTPIQFDPPMYTTNYPGQFQGAWRGMARFGGMDATVFTNRVFDTWHPAFNFTADERDVGGTMICRPDNDPPPYRPLWTDRSNFAAGFGAGGSGGARPLFWLPSTDYAVGARVFPWPNFPDGTGSPASPSHQSFFYVCVEADPPGGAMSGLEQPNWPEAPGARIEDGDGTDRLVWKAIPNTIGLKAIQITLRFFDPTSGQMRQLTITHSFVEL